MDKVNARYIAGGRGNETFQMTEAKNESYAEFSFIPFLFFLRVSCNSDAQ